MKSESEYKLEQKYEQSEINKANRYLFWALNIGEQMLMSGAEVGRVEDSIRRICSAYGAARTDVFTITSSIVATMYGEAFGVVTQTRRISGLKQDLSKLDQMNALSRAICREKLPLHEIEERFKKILNAPKYSFVAQIGIYALVSATFSVFFGGSVLDAVASAVIGALLRCVEELWKKFELNSFVAALFSSILGGVLAIIAVRSGIGQSIDKINIGNIMLLIPGVALTNSIRDMFGGDTMSGVLRFCEAILLSMTIAFGFAFAGVLL